MVNILGREVSTPALFVIGGAGLGGILWFRHNQKNKQTTQQNQPPTTDPSIDPNTGQPYANEYGSYTYEPVGSGYGPSGLDTYSGDYSGGGAYGSMGYYGGGVPYQVPQQASTNAQWTQAAVSALTAQGYNGMAVLAALGLFLTGGALSADQRAIVEAAIAAEGYPPQGPNNINSVPPMSPPIPANGNTVTVPNVVGTNFGNAYNELVRAGLKVSNGRTNSSWRVTAQSLTPNRQVARGTSIRLTVKKG